MRDDDWLDESEYPDDRDIAEFGDDSPPDDDPLTIGYIGDSGEPFWTVSRLVTLGIVLILIGALVVSLVLQFWY